MDVRDIAKISGAEAPFSCIPRYFIIVYNVV